MTIAEANTPVATGIKVIIAKKGLKNLYVAEKAGFTPQELSDMFNGRRLIKACNIPKFAYVLGVKTDDIYAAGRGMIRTAVQYIDNGICVEKVKVDASEVRKTIKKMKRLRKLLKEANSLADELASKKIEITFRI